MLSDIPSWVNDGSEEGGQLLGKIMRRLRKNAIFKALVGDFTREMYTISSLRHPNIATVMGAVLDTPDGIPLIVMELMERGSLDELLMNETFPLEEELVFPILEDIVQGVLFLHSANPSVPHGNLKSANCLVDSSFRCKVCDFGRSLNNKIGGVQPSTPFFMAPEVLRGEVCLSKEADSYSFGILLYEVYARKKPYEGMDQGEVVLAVADDRRAIEMRPGVPKNTPRKIEMLMTSCWNSKAELRPTFKALARHFRELQMGTGHGSRVQQIRESNKRTANVLEDIFPKHVADALVKGQKVDPEHKECVTVFFSDIVGYTEISSSLSGQKVSEMLDRLYSRFDDLASQNDVFKVDTIGDAYVAVTNLAKDQDDHAARMATFARDVLEASSQTLIDVDDPSKGFVQIRVGLNSGPVTASVVGTKNMKYTLFGDTVNVASRMESHSLPGRCQASASTRRLIELQDPSIPVLERGVVDVKGRGPMTLSWVWPSPAHIEEDGHMAATRAPSHPVPPTMSLGRGARNGHNVPRPPEHLGRGFDDVLNMDELKEGPPEEAEGMASVDGGRLFTGFGGAIHQGISPSAKMSRQLQNAGILAKRFLLNASSISPKGAEQRLNQRRTKKATAAAGVARRSSVPCSISSNADDVV